MICGEAAELLGRQVAARDPHLDGDEAGLALGPRVGGGEALELARVAVGARVGGARRRRAGLLVVAEQQRRRVEVALGDPVAAQLLLDLLAEGVHADAVDQHLDAGAGAVGAQLLLAVVDPQHRLGHLQVLAVVGADELVERRREARHDRGAAADPQLEAAAAVADPRDEAAVVDAGDRDVLVGRAERGLELARHQLADLVAHEVAHVGADVGGRVEELALADAGPRVAGDVADRVAAALARREPGARDLADQLRRVGQRHVVQLDVLARRDVALAQRHPALDDVGEGVELLGVDAAEGQLDADHLALGLALAVDALAQAEADELVLGSASPSRNRRASVSKSSNSRSRIGITCPGTFS